MPKDLPLVSDAKAGDEWKRTKSTAKAYWGLRGISDESQGGRRMHSVNFVVKLLRAHGECLGGRWR